MAKVVLEYLDIDEKVNGRATKLTFCCQVEVSEYNHNPAAVVNGLVISLNRCFFEALVEKGAIEEKYVSTYLPRKPPAKEVKSW